MVCCCLERGASTANPLADEEEALAAVEVEAEAAAGALSDEEEECLSLIFQAAVERKARPKV